MADEESLEEHRHSSATQRAALASELRNAAAGDRRAFEEVYRLTSAKLFGICLRVLPTREEAEEALQEVYFAIWRHAGSFDESRGTAMTWLITLTRNRAVDRLRAGGKIAVASLEHAGEIVDGAPSAFDRLEASDDARRLVDCLDQLAGQDALFIKTAFFQGSTYSELATRASMPLGTIKSRIRRALLSLRSCLE